MTEAGIKRIRDYTAEELADFAEAIREPTEEAQRLAGGLWLMQCLESDGVEVLHYEVGNSDEEISVGEELPTNREILAARGRYYFYDRPGELRNCGRRAGCPWETRCRWNHGRKRQRIERITIRNAN